MAHRPSGSVRYWDFAASEADGACFTAGVRGTIWQNPSDRDDWYVAINDVAHGRWSPMVCEGVVKQMAGVDGRSVSIWIEQEPGSAGVIVIARYVRVLRGYSVRGDRPTGDKVERAKPLAAAAEAGLIRLDRGPWNKPFLDELEAFPNGPYKDMVDAAAGMFAKLTLGVHVNQEGSLLCGDLTPEDMGLLGKPLTDEEIAHLPEEIRGALDGLIDPQMERVGRQSESYNPWGD